MLFGLGQILGHFQLFLCQDPLSRGFAVTPFDAHLVEVRRKTQIGEAGHHAGGWGEAQEILETHRGDNGQEEM